MAATLKAGKAKRKEFALYYDDLTVLEIIGKGNEEISIEQGANIETTKDVLGNTEAILDSYEKTTPLDPVYVEGGSKFPEKLDEIEEYEAILDDAEAYFVWVKNYKTDEGKFVAWRQKAIIELTGFGGGTKGVNAPCTLHWIGERTHGSFDPATQKFTETVSPNGFSLGI